MLDLPKELIEIGPNLMNAMLGFTMMVVLIVVAWLFLR